MTTFSCFVVTLAVKEAGLTGRTVPTELEAPG